MSAAGYAVLPTTVSLSGINKELQSQLLAPASKAAKKAGDSIEKGISKGTDNAAAKVEKANYRVKKSSEELADAEAKRNSEVLKSQAAAKQLEAAESKLADMKKSGKASSEQLAKAEGDVFTKRAKVETAAQNVEKAERGVEKAMAESKRASDSLATAQKNLENATDEATGATREFGDAAADADGKGQGFEVSLGKIAAAGAVVVGAVGAAGKAAYDIGAQFDDAYDTIRAGTGASGAAFEELQDSMRKVAGESIGVGSDMGAIGSTLADLNTRLGLTGEPLEKMTAQFMQLQNLGVDADINEVSKAMSGFGIEAKDMPAALDELFQVSQATGLTITELSQSAVKAGPVLRGFGFSMADSAALVGQMDKAGLDADKTLQSMQRALAEFASEGRDAPEALKETIGSIEELINAGDEAAAIDMAAGIFGTRGAAQFVDAVKTGTLSVDDFMDATGATSDTIGGLAEETADFSERWDQFKNQAMLALEPIATKIFDSLVPALDRAQGAFEFTLGAVKGFAEWVQKSKDWLLPLGTGLTVVAGGLAAVAFQQKIIAAGGLIKWFKSLSSVTKLMTGVQAAFNMVMAANPIMLVVTAIAALVAGLVVFFTKTETGRKMWDSFTKALGAGWDWVVEKFQAGIEWVKTAFSGLKDLFVNGDFTGALRDAFGVEEDNPIVNMFLKARDAMVGFKDLLVNGDFTGALRNAFGVEEDSPIVQKILTIRDTFITVVDFVKAKWEEFTTGFGQFYQTWIAPVVGFIGTAFGVLKDIAVGAWQAMQDKWSEFTQGFGEFYQTWIAPIVDVMMTGFQVLGSVVSAAFNGIWTAIQFVGSVISAVWSGAIQPVLSLFMSVVQSVASFVVPIFTAVIGGAFRTMGSLISNVWNGVIKPAWDFFRNAAGLLADVLTGNFSNIRNRFSSMGQAISNIVHGVINSAMNFFKAIFENAKQVAASFGQAIGRMVGTVRNKIGEMMGVLGQIPGKVQGVFASAGTWLVNAGKNIINGLINGIKSMFGQVENAIGSVMPDKIRGMIGFSNGGVYMAEGGITRAYIDGGIDKLERYANGGSKEQHKAQIAKGGEWRIWAEPETGGESYIPLAKSKRKRSTQILAKTADIFGLTVLDKKGNLVDPGTASQVAPAKTQYFANGGITVKSLRDFVEGRSANGHQAARSLEGAPYVWGGSNWGDCSGAMSAVAAFAAGINPFPRKFATGNEAAWLSSHGFKSGRGKKGDLRIGFKNGGPAGGHTAGTLPDGTNIEMGGGRGNGQIGGRAAGAWDSYFDTFFYKTIKPPKPPKMNKILDQNAIPDGSTMTIDGVPVSVSSDDTTGSAGENTVTVALSPEDAAKATAAKGLGDQSILDFAVDGIFDMLGMKDSTIKKLLTTKGKDLLPSGESIVTTQQVKEQPRTNVAAKNAEAIESDAATSLSPAKMAKDPQLAAPKPEKKKGPTWGPDFFAGEIARKAKDMRLDKLAARIGIATALVESGNPLKMWANRAVPESLKFRHDAVGSDYDSVGLFQQRDNGAWGTVKQRMTPYDSAGMFFDKLKGFDYHAMDPGAAAQKVQVSAFPDRYGQQMGNAENLLNKVGVFDQGGWLKPGGIAVNLSNEPEPVFNGDQWRDIKRGGLKSDDGMTLVVNLEGQEVLRKRMDKVEGEVTINTEELNKLRRRTGVAVAATTRGGAM
ncbi:phage tail tape measure protein [Corynebacterium simulans]|uniref:phage tail tape measure protein n=1 Tax=Corynebacterium simulans TaxID=146827 RepID=UPI00254D613B|nr:phage tail tape measure protein [Corynebacterium simulans]MDK7139721.1 phage tail tape measure protein [Corynebacterium simulans]